MRHTLLLCGWAGVLTAIAWAAALSWKYGPLDTVMLVKHGRQMLGQILLAMLGILLLVLAQLYA